MRTDIIEYLQKEVYHRCKQPTNKFGMGCYYHIEAVVKNAEILAEKYGADKETVIIAAWLHDIASITDYAMYEEHHKYGADIAKEILNELNYDKEKTALVQKCILNHRGSVKLGRTSIEELLDTKVKIGNLIDTIEYDYPNFHLLMDCFWCEIVSGELKLKEHENAKWLTKEHLDEVEWLPADVILIDKIRMDM